MEATAPGEPLVGSALTLIEMGVDAHALELLDHSLGAEVLLRAATHEEVVHLLVEVGSVVEDTVGHLPYVHAEQSAGEGTDVREFLQVWQGSLPRLTTTPRETCHGTMLAVGEGAEGLVNHRNEVGMERLDESVTIVGMGGAAITERRLGVATLHDDNHRFALTGSNHVV